MGEPPQLVSNSHVAQPSGHEGGEELIEYWIHVGLSPRAHGLVFVVNERDLVNAAHQVPFERSTRDGWTPIVQSGCDKSFG